LKKDRGKEGRKDWKQEKGKREKGRKRDNGKGRMERL
jgi:hypothetical protein